MVLFDKFPIAGVFMEMDKENCFDVISKKAAIEEKNMNIVSAFELWKQASLLCKNAENINWCINRAMFCEAFLNRNPKM